MYAYKYKNNIIMLDYVNAEYVRNDIDNKNFVFDIFYYDKKGFYYGEEKIPYEYLGADKNTAYLIDRILAQNKISYIAVQNGNGKYRIYLAHSGKYVPLDAMFRFIFHANECI